MRYSRYTHSRPCWIGRSRQQRAPHGGPHGEDRPLEHDVARVAVEGGAAARLVHAGQWSVGGKQRRRERRRRVLHPGGGRA